MLSLEFWECLAHLTCQYGDELIDKCLLLSEECVSIAYSTAKDTTNYVACLGVRRQLAIGDREGYSTQVVGTYAHCHIGFFAYTILKTCNSLLFLDDWLEDVGVVVGVLVLHGTNKTLEAHTGINNVHRQRNERAIGLALVLHEHDIPNLDNLWVVLVYEFTSWSLSLLLGCTRVEMNL